MSLIKFVIILGLVMVVTSLFTALYYLYRDRGHGMRMVRMLGVRVALSMALIVFLVVAYKLGWIPEGGLR